MIRYKTNAVKQLGPFLVKTSLMLEKTITRFVFEISIDNVNNWRRILRVVQITIRE